MRDNPFSSIEDRLMRLEQLLVEVRSDQLNGSKSNKPDLMTVYQASEFTSYAVQTLYGKVHRREIPYMKRGGKLWFSRDILEDWIKDSREKTITEGIEDMLQSAARRGKSKK